MYDKAIIVSNGTLLVEIDATKDPVRIICVEDPFRQTIEQVVEYNKRPPYCNSYL